MRRILITGSNRGIGLALVEQYLTQSDNLIFATCRSPERADRLRFIAEKYSDRVIIVPLDVIDEESITNAVSTISQHVNGLDMLINNAGILPGGVDNRESNISVFGQLESSAMLKVFEVNTISPVIITQAIADLLKNGNDVRIINVSSDAGSIVRRDEGCDYSYPASKAALNMMSRCLAGDLHDENIIVISIHPGFIKTDMGGVSARLELDDAIPTMVKTIDTLTMKDSGLFFNWDGNLVKW